MEPETPVEGGECPHPGCHGTLVVQDVQAAANQGPSDRPVLRSGESLRCTSCSRIFTERVDDPEFPAYVLMAKQRPPSEIRCKWCEQLQVHVLTTPVRIYYHCGACQQSWYEAKSESGL